MTIAIQPPAYFPPLAYTSLIAHVDHFILADTFRFRSDTFHNRSKLRNAQGGHWITIPLFGHPEGAPLRDVEIETKGRWQEKHWRSFLYDYRTTMYFDHLERRLSSFFDVTWRRLAECTCRSVDLQTDLLGLGTPLTRASALEGEPETLGGVVETVEADILVVPEAESVSPGAAPVVHRFAFEHPTYHQNFEGFEAGVSAMDLLLNYGPEARRILGQAANIETGEIA